LKAPTRPILRYHGGKWKLAPWIITHLPPHAVYVEPFGGGASVLLRKPRCYAEVYNDLDGEVVNVFRVLQNAESARELRRRLELTPFAREEYERCYAPTDDPIERARRVIFRAVAGIGTDSVLTRRGFRNSTRRNPQRITVAWEWASFPEQVGQFVERLRGVVIENRDYRAVIRQHDSPETLFYVDPPYLPETRSGHAQYTHELSAEEHRELAAILQQVHGMVVLSGYPSALYQELYPGWRMETRPAFAHGAAPRTEALYLSPRVQILAPALFSTHDG
jgi:DNA adenine methylase